MRVLRIKEAYSRLGISRSTFYNLISNGTLPKPFKIHPNGRAVGYREEQIEAYIRGLNQEND